MRAGEKINTPCINVIHHITKLILKASHLCHMMEPG